MPDHDPDRDDPAPDDAPAAAEPTPSSPETKHIEEDGEPLGANFA